MGKNKAKVYIGIPCQDTIKAKTAFSLVHAVRNVDFEYDFIMRLGCDIIGSRAWLARQAVKNGSTHLLFVDSDMFFPPIKEKGRFVSPITRLLEQDKDIIGASYNFRSLPEKSTAFPLAESPDKSRPYKCHAVGTGFLLIKTSVFEKVEEPWFQFGRNAEGEMVRGEDVHFCQKAIEAGYEVWADPTIGVKHLGEYLY